jgi:DNA helicase TIP49 (TBP-interacting protein)
MAYIKRLLEDDLLAKMAASGAVLIKGPKSSGKTETATLLELSKKLFYFKQKLKN